MAPTTTTPLNGSPIAEQQWRDWLADQERISFDEYERRPNRLVSDFNGEKTFTADYIGREILELLQNANDAAAKAEKRGSVRFELLPAGLIAANTGAPFSQAGVASLRLPHTSPKPGEGPQMVGNKGLGFRAVLNWTRFPIVLSADLAIVFSARVAKQKQEELARRSEELAECIKRQQALSGELVVPLLAFAGFSHGADLTGYLDDEAQRKIYTRCQELRKQGYDTVIGMPFDRNKANDIALSQIEVLRPEVLLFARSIEKLEVAVEGKTTTTWRHYPSEADTSRVYLGADDTAFQEWKVYSRRAPVPRRYLPADQPNATDYEIILAIPRSREAATSHLYSYFPTQVQFPYPVVCHVTLDLKADRQQPQQTPANHFIVGRLAKFMAETAAHLAKDSNDAGLKLLTAQSPVSDGLEQFDFRSRLRQAARARTLVSTRANGLSTPPAARRTDFADTSWLPEKAFPAVVSIQDGESLLPTLKWLEVPSLAPADWTNAAPQLTFKTIAERADFITGVIRNNVTAAYDLPGLLLAADGNPVPKGYRVFLPPANQTQLALPTWFDIRFFHSDLRRALMDRLDPKDQDAFAAQLSPLGVSRYSLDSILSALAAQANKWAEAEPASEDDTRCKLIQALRSLFPSTTPKDERPRFPRDALVRVRTLAGTYEDVRKVYLSAEYGARGCILEDLYRPSEPGKLIATPASLGLDSADAFAADFLLWLGVADLPRETIADSPDCPFTHHVKSGLPEPIQMGEYFFKSVDEIPSPTLRQVTTLDGLDTFLKSASPAAILAWLATDHRSVAWKSPSASHGKIGCWKPYAQYARLYDGPIPSYIRWKLQTTRWLPTRRGGVAAPQECLAEAVQGIEDLLPLPARPTSEQLQRYGMPAQQFRDALDRAGVLPGFSQIDPEQLYDLLSSLPTRNPNGSLAKSVYTAVLRHFDSADVRDSPARERFIRSGKIWARTETGEAYCSTHETRHVDSEDIPASLCKKLNVAALPKRSGTQKVEALFGVKAIERGQIKRRILSHQSVPDGDIINDEIEHIKPLILALRRSQRQEARESLQFRQLKITVCSSVEGEVEYGGQKEPLQLGTWDWILDDETHTAYILSDPQESDRLNSDLLADAVGQIFAAVFRVERGDDFARLVMCQRKNRLRVLKRLIGDEDIPGMEELERRYREEASQVEAQEIHLPDTGLLPPIAPPVQPVVVTPPSTPVVQPASDGKGQEKPLEIAAKPHTPAPQSAGIACRVTRTLSPGPHYYGGARRVTDGTFCEYKAMEFEECDTPPRFPLRVAGVTGYEAPGVDVLSFATEEDRTLFKKGDHRDTIIVRFIEVKGRASEAAKIDLRDNAVKAARRYHDKYYLYRIFDRGTGSYELAVLKNPINDETGARAFYEINLEAATRTEEFSLAGGITEFSYRQNLANRAAENQPPPASPADASPEV
jgi:hypothetical protein